MRRRIRFQSLMLLAAIAAAAVGVGLAGATGSAWLFVAGLAATILAGAIGWQLAALAQALETCLERGERLRLLGQVSGGLAHQLRNGVAGANWRSNCMHDLATATAKSLDVARRQLARIESDLARFLDLGRQRTCTPTVPSRRVGRRGGGTRCGRNSGTRTCNCAGSRRSPTRSSIGDPGRLGHIVVNLLTNAVEAAGPGGQVEVTRRTNRERIVHHRGLGQRAGIARPWPVGCSSRS